MIKEDFLHFIWKFKLFSSEYLVYSGEKIEILDPGVHNLSSGPDFFNAKIKIGKTTWAGNVEIHNKASDWYKHGHQNDPVYDSIILHMVLEEDIQVTRQSGEEIPTARFVIHSEIQKKYDHLISESDYKDCYRIFPGLDPVLYRDWIGKLGFLRLERKVKIVDELLKNNQFNWELVLYQSFASALGMKLNAEPFLMLSRSVPLSFVWKKRDNINTIFAAYLGQAGFLSRKDIDDSFYSELKKEYDGIKALLPPGFLQDHHWKKLHRRPGGFPLPRLFQFAVIIRNLFPMFEKLKEGQTAREIKLDIEKCLRNFKNTCQPCPNQWLSFYLPTRSTINVWIINGIIPVLFAYGKYHKNDLFIQKAMDILEELAPEKNEILKNWNKFGIYAENAFESQALIELKNQFCLKQACTDCFLGHKLLSDADKK